MSCIPLKHYYIMKKLLLLILLALPSFTMAQSEWEVVEKANPSKEKKAGKKAKKVVDAKYLAGAVPVVDGKVVFEKTISAPGVSVSDIYNRTLKAITALTQEPNQKENSRVVAVNKKENIIAAAIEEEMLFSNKLIARDFTIARYTIIATCSEGAVNVKINRIWYEYDKGRATEATYHADEWITDKVSLSKNGQKLYRANGKFRIKTIDRKDDIFGKIETAVRN